MDSKIPGIRFIGKVTCTGEMLCIRYRDLRASLDYIEERGEAGGSVVEIEEPAKSRAEPSVGGQEATLKQQRRRRLT